MTFSERHALHVVHMSAAALRYVPRPDPDPSLRERIVAWRTATGGTVRA